MYNQLPKPIITIYQKFQSVRFEIYLVGGCIRNMLLGKIVKDWDFTTNATPDEILKLFPEGFYDNQFGTVGIPLELNNEQHVLEITTFRTEREYKNFRHPEVTWGKTIEEDLERRDFTMNAIAMKLTPSNSPLVRGRTRPLTLSP